MKKILISIILTPVIFLLIAGGLILSQSPQPLPSDREGLDFSGILAGEGSVVREPTDVPMRDGTVMPVRLYGEPDNGPLLVLIHGSGWHGMQFDGLARALSGDAFVVVPDLRGHGAKPERRGDVDHIGQYEEDLADLIDNLRQDGQKVVVAGHSSGGGLVVRMAGGAYGDRMDKAILLAPFLKYNAPTMRPDAGGWTQALTRRIIGLTMLNMVGITTFNDLQVIQLAMPRAVLVGPLGHTATTTYTYRLNNGFAPREDYLKDAAALPPFLLIAGSDDEAFVAEAYEPLLSDVNTGGSYALIDGVGHLDIVDNAETVGLIRAFLGGA